MFKLYYHGGSENHGCEAIVRSTCKILGENVKLYSSNIEGDKKYNLDEIVSINEDVEKLPKKNTLTYFLSAIYFKIKKSDYAFVKNAHRDMINDISPEDILFSIGGDNYCYEGREKLDFYNRAIHKKKARTILWGCSVEPADLNDDVKKDISNYDLIIARESYTYNELKKINSSIELYPDPAFCLDKKKLPLPEGFIDNNTVGINVSPLIMKLESESGVTKKNYEELINYILNQTDMNIALIPHVVEYGNDDRTVLKEFYEKFASSNRIVLIDDCNAMELKGYISCCRFFVGARTHATIAAYSTGVPTLVVGYSIKARGIAKDIFGTEDNYVIPVQDLRESNQLVKKFEWLLGNETDIKNYLDKVMPEYIEKVMSLKNIINKMQ